MTDVINPEMQGKPIRYACSICDQLFDTRAEAEEHVFDVHQKTFKQIYIRATYRET